MVWTNTNSTTVSHATKKSEYDAVFDNSKFLRDSVGDFTYLIIGTGIAGTKTAPIISWRDDTDTGIYRIGANNIGITCGDTKILDITSSNLSVAGSLTLAGAITGATSIACTSLSMAGAITGATSIACTSITGLSGLAVGGALSTVTSLSMGGAITGATTISTSGAINGLTISSGAISGATSLSMAGAITGATSIACTSITGLSGLAVGGALSGVTTINQVRITLGDIGGIASYFTLTGYYIATQISAINVNKSSDGVSATAHTGYLKSYIGTTAIYIPYMT